MKKIIAVIFYIYPIFVMAEQIGSGPLTPILGILEPDTKPTKVQTEKNKLVKTQNEERDAQMKQQREALMKQERDALMKLERDELTRQERDAERDALMKPERDALIKQKKLMEELGESKNVRSIEEEKETLKKQKELAEEKQNSELEKFTSNYTPKYFHISLKLDSLSNERCKPFNQKEYMKFRYLWMQVDSNVDKKSAEMCLALEEKYLNGIINSYDKISKEAELKSDAATAQKRSDHINKNIKNLSAANCVWKALDALNTPIRESLNKIKNDPENAPAYETVKLLGTLFGKDEFAINHDEIYTSFINDTFNLPVVFKRVNSALIEDASIFKKRYFRSEGIETKSRRELNRQAHREQARRERREVDKTMENMTDATIKMLEVTDKVYSPLRLEILATGVCTTYDDSSAMKDYVRFSR